MKQQHTLHPKLRFPEFEGDWKEFSFKEIFNFSTGKNIKQKEAAPHFETPCVRYGELYYMYKEVISNIINYTNLDKSELKFSEGDEILLPSAGEDPMDIGSASALTLKNVAIGRTINILKPKNKNVYSSIFASYYINQKLRIKISGLAKGVSISNVYNTDLQTLFIKLPSLPEQQKIADYLSTIDTKINLLEEKKAQLVLYKKAMMQKLFSQEIRFKPTQCHTEPVEVEPVEVEPVEVELMETYPEWEEKRLEDVFTVTRGQVLAVSKMKINSDNIFKYPVYSSQTRDNGLTGFYDEYLYQDAITWTTDGANAGTVLFRRGKFYCTNVCGVLISNEGNSNNCIAEMINMIAKKYVSYVGNPKLMNNVMAKIKIYFPSVQEQQKIANFLSAIDESIEKVTEQISQTQSFKKAMLQQMFV